MSPSLTLSAPWDVPLGRRRPPSSSCISEHSSSSSSSMMSERSDPRLLSVWYSSPWQQCGWAGRGDTGGHRLPRELPREALPARCPPPLLCEMRQGVGATHCDARAQGVTVHTLVGRVAAGAPAGNRHRAWAAGGRATPGLGNTFSQTPLAPCLGAETGARPEVVGSGHSVHVRPRSCSRVGCREVGVCAPHQRLRA